MRKENTTLYNTQRAIDNLQAHVTVAVLITGTANPEMTGLNHEMGRNRGRPARRRTSGADGSDGPLCAGGPDACMFLGCVAVKEAAINAVRAPARVCPMSAHVNTMGGPAATGKLRLNRLGDYLGNHVAQPLNTERGARR